MNRLLFIIFYRFIYKIRYRNLRISIFSYVKNSKLANNVGIYGASSVINSEIGSYSYINSSIVHNSAIGKYSSVAHGVIIGPGSHSLDKFSTSPVFEDRADKKRFSSDSRTQIGNDVWIGVGATILDGIYVANGSIIAAGAIVTKSTEPYGIYAGVPARLVRFRFSKNIISSLIQTEWWELNPAEILALDLAKLLENNENKLEVEK